MSRGHRVWAHNLLDFVLHLLVAKPERVGEKVSFSPDRKDTLRKKSKKSCLKVEQLKGTVCIEHEMYMKRTGKEDVEKVSIEYPVNRITGFAANNALDCICCLMVHSEVFFIYAPTIDSNTGYVWMTQNHDDIIHVCLERHCLKLWFYKEAEHLQAGFRRPLCLADIQYPFQKIKSKVA
uniref:AlNc14C163G7819 protein n=1 Tax=Albugo laibachii Nc14 TaxID=890382 RepID=F0WMY2_9STRA|nr:AlNc14C163G7819 [Albugo laibachii Nc14]|eukprot:CCA22669.1 AlNc14C163G7819 [Albugo laibachii Nc14]